MDQIYMYISTDKSASEDLILKEEEIAQIGKGRSKTRQFMFYYEVWRR
jgi:hypothetical protein